MSNPTERPTGSTMGYEQGQAGQAEGGQPMAARDTGQAGQEPHGTRYRTTGRHEAAEEHRGAVVGFTALAGTLMVLGGLWGIIVGIVVLSSGHFYVRTPASGYTYVWSLHGWGWAEIILGIVVFAAGVSVFLGMPWARYVGAFLAVLSAIGNFMFIPFTPIWSIIMIVIDGFIIWALLHPRQEVGEF